MYTAIPGGAAVEGLPARRRGGARHEPWPSGSEEDRDMTETPIGFGILGSGNMARVYADALATQVTADG